ncbi:DivIVA domain-containing protein [Gudongella oleilytica]|uniref:DivIVA domain-containing protein n=1 Tax=Gudongella oleilytica TaxID=1582259 RepID=UPI002A36606E|nr:DivIVA domain-containing protein [Gudongella oleilytica]MDY0256945.1 DivIVA domain-containing protein [Gudongella oleilytica]
MITPLDIQNKVFSRSFRGYSPKAVNSFLNEILEDYEKMYKENIEYKDKISMLTDQIRQYNTMEETLKNTLIIAQKTAEEVALNARSKADLIIGNAEDEGRRLIEKTKEEVRDIKDEYDQLRKEMYIFKTRYESFLQSQSLSLNNYYKEAEEFLITEVNSVREEQGA